MKIQLEQPEIEQAVREYVANQGIKVEGKSLSLKFRMTRGEDGLLGDLTIDEPVAAASPAKGIKAVRAGTVGEAINKQSEKPAGTVNTLPTTAAGAVDEAKAKVAESSEANTDNKNEPAQETGETQGEPEPAKTTTSSLFG